MVLERIFPANWLEKKAYYAFILGAAYSVIGILIAAVIFPKSPSLPAVAFTSLLLLPELYKIFSIEERQEKVSRGVDINRIYKDDIDVTKVYLFLFLGILITYGVGAMILPYFSSNLLFADQLAIRGVSGSAIASPYMIFTSILKNNFIVLAAIFIISLLAGDGAVFLVAWNASVWGTIFGITAKNAALLAKFYPDMSVIILPHAFQVFILIMAIVLPHVILEAAAYILSAISGSIISKALLMEKFTSKRIFKVFKFNIYLLLIALGFLIIGALVETFVLGNSITYQNIIEQSLLIVR